MNRSTITGALSAFLCFLTAAPAFSQKQANGHWRLGPPSNRDLSPTMLSLTMQASGSEGTTVDQVRLEELRGLSADRLRSGGAQARFELKRDAGTFLFEGSLGDGRGSGEFSFSASPGFADELARRGISRPTGADQFSLALYEIGLAYVDELREQGYGTPTVADLVRAGRHGAGLEYLRGMGAAGYRVGSLAELVRMRDHGVNPEYVRDLAELGIRDVPAPELVRMRDHGVTPAFVRELAAGGYRGLSTEQLVRLRDRGVDARLLAELKAQGTASPD